MKRMFKKILNFFFKKELCFFTIIHKDVDYVIRLSRCLEINHKNQKLYVFQFSFDTGKDNGNFIKTDCGDGCSTV